MRHAIRLSLRPTRPSPATASAVPEWDGRKVFVMEENPAYLTLDAYRFFRPRQERFYLVR